MIKRRARETALQKHSPETRTRTYYTVRRVGLFLFVWPPACRRIIAPCSRRMQQTEAKCPIPKRALLHQQQQPREVIKFLGNLKLET